MDMAALAEPLTVKISSKRQITIPAKIYEGAGFRDYALCTWIDKGMLLQPLDVEDEDVTVDILRYLIEQGCEGEDLIAQLPGNEKEDHSLESQARPSRTRYRRRTGGLLREHAGSRTRKVWLLKFASPLHSSSDLLDALSYLSDGLHAPDAAVRSCERSGRSQGIACGKPIP